jgi:hypothetical protein
MAMKSDGCHGNLYERYIKPLLGSAKSEAGSSALHRFSLKPLVEKDIPRVYPGEEKFIQHMDSAGAHLHENTIHWLQERKIKFIMKEEWMSNLQDLSPMDYAVNSIFKRICNRQKAKNMKQLVTIAKRVWIDFGQGIVHIPLLAWPKRVDKMIGILGYQIENTVCEEIIFLGENCFSEKLAQCKIFVSSSGEVSLSAPSMGRFPQKLKNFAVSSLLLH